MAEPSVSTRALLSLSSSFTHKRPSHEKAGLWFSRKPVLRSHKNPSRLYEWNWRSGLYSLSPRPTARLHVASDPIMCFELCPSLAPGLNSGIMACCMHATQEEICYVRRQAACMALQLTMLHEGVVTAMHRSTLYRRRRVPRPPQHAPMRVNCACVRW